MKADASVEIDEVAIDVVEHLKGRTLFCQKNGEAPSERFDVASMRWDEREDLTEQARFSAGPNDGGFCTTRRDQIMIVRSRRE